MLHRLRRQFGPFLEIFRALRANFTRPRYAWRILRDGVCDGCALGTSGLRDWTLPSGSTHLCWIRLNLLPLNTMRAFDPARLPDLATLRGYSEAKLRALGRIPVPLLRKKGETRFRAADWAEAMELMTNKLRAPGFDPARFALYLVSRGTVNETYYVAQKAARLIGTNHIDNSARICHAPSTTALKRTIGYAATTCSYSDLIGTDLIVFIGSDAANNQPVMMKYLYLAKKQGTKVAVINPYREPGMERYWIPSNADSALMGTNICDHYFPVRVGGDVAFINGVLKHLDADAAVDQTFLNEHTAGWPELKSALAGMSIEDLERDSGASREHMADFARLYAGVKSAIFVWSMGVTMHKHGVANVESIANLALARGMVGRPKTGLMPIRGHSGVQGGAEMGCVPNVFPGGHSVDAEGARALGREWGFEPPHQKGHYVAETVDAAHRGEIDFLYCVGGNLFGVLPDSKYVREALERIPFRVHHDIVLNPQMLVDSEEILVLPATTRYEMRGGNTETSTERRVIFNPEIPGPRVAEARDEWRVLAELAGRVRPENAELVQFETTAQIREEIARVIPMYRGIESLSKKGDQFQWGGPMLASENRFGFPDGRARFTIHHPPRAETEDGVYRLSTRRGKQFNSMVFGPGDNLTGGKRDTIVLSRADMDKLALREGDSVRLQSETGEMRGRVRPGQIHPGTVMTYWPEANVLIPRGVSDPECGIPAYRDARVRIMTDKTTPRGETSP